MKKIMIMLLLFGTFSATAQEFKNRDRIKALKVAFITEQLALTSTEAQKFWPIYNAFEDDEHKLRRQSFENRKNTDFDTLSEKDAKAMLDDMISVENQKNKLREKYVNDLLKVIPAKKIILLKVTEDGFNKRMLEEMKKRRGQKE